jgi:hypothetical protein
MLIERKGIQMPICQTCDINVPLDECLIVVIETDTGGTLVSRRMDDNSEEALERFTNRYHALVDSGRYPNMSNPQVECKGCRGIRYKEMEEEAEYWRRKQGYYD